MSKHRKKKKKSKYNLVTKKDSNQKEQHSVTEIKTASFFSGPLPHPEMFKKYEEILPGSADRILTMAEEQGKHRREIEKVVIRTESKSSSRGSVFAFILAIVVVLVGGTLVFFDKPGWGMVIILGGLGTLVGTFIKGRKDKSKDLTEKDENLKSKNNKKDTEIIDVN